MFLEAFSSISPHRHFYYRPAINLSSIKLIIVDTNSPTLGYVGLQSDVFVDLRTNKRVKVKIRNPKMEISFMNSVATVGARFSISSGYFQLPR